MASISPALSLFYLLKCGLFVKPLLKDLMNSSGALSDSNTVSFASYFFTHDEAIFFQPTWSDFCLIEVEKKILATDYEIRTYFENYGEKQILA